MVSRCFGGMSVLKHICRLCRLNWTELCENWIALLAYCRTELFVNCSPWKIMKIQSVPNCADSTELVNWFLKYWTVCKLNFTLKNIEQTILEYHKGEKKFKNRRSISNHGINFFGGTSISLPWFWKGPQTRFPSGNQYWYACFGPCILCLINHYIFNRK
jgi:hypothetical protein